jgi:hypothetical protein
LINIPQTAYVSNAYEYNANGNIENIKHMSSHELCLKDKKIVRCQLQHIEEESNKYHAQVLVQAVGTR